MGQPGIQFQGQVQMQCLSRGPGLSKEAAYVMDQPLEMLIESSPRCHTRQVILRNLR